MKLPHTGCSCTRNAPGTGHVETAVQKMVTTQITLAPTDSIEMILRANSDI